jgi:hypothetical protein
LAMDSAMENGSQNFTTPGRPAARASAATDHR